MNKTLVNLLKYLVFVAIAGGLLYLAFKGNDPAKMLADLKRADYTWVILGMICGYIAFILRGLRWSLLLNPMGYKPGAWNSINSVAVGYLANLAVPRLGEVTRCTVMNRSEKIPVDTLFGTVLAERIIDLVMLGGCFLITFVFKFELLTEFINSAMASKKSGGDSVNLPLILALLAVFGLGAIFMAWKYQKQLRKIKLLDKIFGFIEGVGKGILSVLKLDRKWLFIAYTAAIWICYFLMSYLYFRCLPETYHLGPADGLFIMIIGSLGIIAPAPGGIGAFHAAVMAGMLALGISSEIGLSVAVIVHSSQTLMTLIGGSIGLILLSLGSKKSKDAVLR